MLAQCLRIVELQSMASGALLQIGGPPDERVQEEIHSPRSLMALSVDVPG